MRANDLSAAASQTARLSYPGGLERLDVLGPTAKHAFRNEGREEAVPSPLDCRPASLPRPGGTVSRNVCPVRLLECVPGTECARRDPFRRSDGPDGASNNVWTILNH